jgi:predicted dienelactone hydrolase
VAQVREYSVAEHEETYVDTTRPTPPNGTYRGAPSRTLTVSFFAPDGPGPLPLVLFSHGVAGAPRAFQRLLTDIARSGYLVAAPAYPLSRFNAPGGAAVTDLKNQPGDASFVIDRVLAANQASGWLHGKVDPTRIGAAGHSLGGITTYQLVYNKACHDARIKAIVAMSAFNGGCPGPGIANVHVPLLATHGTDDTTIPYKLGQGSFNDAARPKYLLTVLGGSHTGEERGGSSPPERALTESIIAFFDQYLRGVPGALARLNRVATVPGVTTFTAQP